MQLTILNQLPDGILNVSACQLHELISSATLINLPGHSDEVLFISVLLHGNEVTGWEAVKSLLKKYQDNTLPRAISLFIGNVDAAREGCRVLDGQHDFNRVWNPFASGEHHYPFVQQLFDELARIKPLMAIDIHNNTGLNPHYACVNRLDKDFLHLARLFSRTVVYFIKPDTVLSMAMSRFCPAVTVECGKPDDPAGMEHALGFLQACLQMDHFPAHPPADQDLDVFHTVATVYVEKDAQIGFGDEEAEINFIPHLDRLNFNELSVGTVLAEASKSDSVPFVVQNEQGKEVSEQYFANRDGQVATVVPIMPSMLTLNRDIIQQDCLCYLMERYPLSC